MQKRLNFALALVLTGGILASCGTPAEPAPAPGTDPGTNPALPSDVSALVIEAVDSPVYDELAKRVRMVPYDGSQKIEDHDMVIFDGDAHSPEAVRDHELVRAAMRAHKWVLALDATAEHKQTGLGGYLLASTKGKSSGYFVRITQELTGHVGTQTLELPAELTPFGDFAVTAQTLNANTEATNGGAKLFVSNALRELRSERVYPLQVDPNPPTVPNYVNYYPFYHSQIIPWTAKGAHKANKNGTQSVFYRANYIFEVFLDTSQKDEGDFQWLSVRIDGEANPTNGTNNFVNRAHDEQAYFQDQFLFSVTPTDTYSSQFNNQGNSPENQSGVTTVTSGLSFTVGLSSDGPSSSFQYSSRHCHVNSGAT